MPLPPALLQAIAAPHGGQVVLILGAGCSFDAPTSLPLSRQVSLAAHERLLNDNILQPGDCPHPEDLSALADSVFQKTGGQDELVTRMPKSDFLLAQPNEGYLLAAALLREQALLAVITLNFDLAASHALVNIGGGEVTVLNGPQAGLAGITNLIYLHRNAHSPNNEWILRTAALAQEWQGRWEELITQRAMTASVCVFVGLGSPAGVLVASVQRLRQSNAHSTAFVVGLGPANESPFLAHLALPETSYIQSNWKQFMEALSTRVVRDHQAQLALACDQVRRTNQWDAEDVTNLCERIAQLGLLGMGQLRAMWLLEKDAYLPFRGLDTGLWADLTLTVALIERLLGLRAAFVDGMLEFMDGNRRIALVAPVSGRGRKRWLAVETDVREKTATWAKRGKKPTAVIVTGFIASATERATPANLVTEYEKGDIVDADSDINMLSAYDLRENPELIRHMVN
jgi:hypothetical protein